jgi:replicative DNA helicase
MTQESILLGCMLIDPACVDRALHGGLKQDAFTDPLLGLTYKAMLELRTSGQEVSLGSLVVKMGDACPLMLLMEAERGTTAPFDGAMKAVLWDAKKRELKPAISGLLNELERLDGCEAVEARINALKAISGDLAGSGEKTVKDIAEEALQDARLAFAGSKPTGKVVETGLLDFDIKITPIQSHEYVVVGARTSTGKSSFMAQLAGHNLSKGLKIAYFTLETSAKSLIAQMAAQRARVNLRALAVEIRESQQRYEAKLQALAKTKDLLIFDADLTMDKIEARCRLLASTFKPDVVFIDYLGLIQVGKVFDSYERMSFASKRMIPLRKSLGCALVVAAQLNRGPEKDDRQPVRTDFRDAGGIEEDAHRIIAIHRPGKNFNGIPQCLDQDTYDYELLQLKLRDGPLGYAKCRFYAPHTLFQNKID